MTVRPPMKLVIAASLLVLPLVGCTGSTEPELATAPPYVPPATPPPAQVETQGKPYGQSSKYQEAMEREFGGGAR